MAPNTDKITTTQVLVPMTVMAFSLFLFFAFQSFQVMQERDNLKANMGKLDSALEQSQKLNAQFGGLVVGTQKLAGEGNAIAKDFVGRLKKIGVIMEPKAEPMPVEAPAGMVPAGAPAAGAAPITPPPGMVPAGLPANLKPMSPMAPVPAAREMPAKGPIKP